MKKQEFLEDLRTQLIGEIDQVELMSHIRYYDQYFEEEEQRGKTQEEIIQQLGEPFLLAKTIIETSQTPGSTRQGVYEENYAYREQEEASGSSKRGFHVSYDGGKWDIRFGRFKLNSWYGKLLGVLLIVLLLTAIVKITSAVLSVLLPLLLPIFLIGLIVTVIRSKGPRQ